MFFGFIRHKCFSSRPAEFGFGLEPCGYRSQSDLRPRTTLACRCRYAQLGYGARSTQVSYRLSILVDRKYRKIKLFKKNHYIFIYYHARLLGPCPPRPQASRINQRAPSPPVPARVNLPGARRAKAPNPNLSLQRRQTPEN